MSKPFLIVTFSHRAMTSLAFWVVCVAITGMSACETWAQDNSEKTPAYPLSVAVKGGEVFTVDLDLPGVWRTDDSGRSLYVEGSNRLRQPLNRPRAIAIHPAGGILVGDSATREVYHIAAEGAEPKPLTSGYLGNAMALAVSPDGKTIFVGDAEKRALFKLPIEGGKSELVARVNARGLAFDGDSTLWAVTPDDTAIVKVDVTSGEVTPVVSGRPFQYPNGLVWAGDHGFVTDGYGKCIWKFTADGKTEKWHEGDPLVGPVGLFVTDSSLWVADPKQKQVYQFNLETKETTTKL